MTLPSAAEVKNQIAQDMLAVMRKLGDMLDAERRGTLGAVPAATARPGGGTAARRAPSAARPAGAAPKVECKPRQRRFRAGFKGLRDRLTRQHSRIKTQKERETHDCFVRDRAEKEQMIFEHLEERRGINAITDRERNERQDQKQELRQDVQGV